MTGRQPHDLVIGQYEDSPMFYAVVEQLFPSLHPTFRNGF